MDAISKRLLTLIWLFATIDGLTGAEPLKLQSGQMQTPLLEMFTSEGCSSCPPAEAWFSKLKDSPKLWKDFIPVAFHVDYWDHPWKDPFSSKSFTERQGKYAKAWQNESIYTPGFVWSSIEWRGWFKGEKLPRSARPKVGLLTASSEDLKRWMVEFEPALTNRISYDVRAALLGFDLTSKVTAGENKGRVLRHDCAVISWVESSLNQQGNTYRSELVFPQKLSLMPKRTAIAIWVEPAKSVGPVQALGAWLTDATIAVEPKRK
jgi:hypothetical protein